MIFTQPYYIIFGTRWQGAYFLYPKIERKMISWDNYEQENEDLPGSIALKLRELVGREGLS